MASILRNITEDTINPGTSFKDDSKRFWYKKEDYLLELCRYVVLNPVRAGIVEKPEAWRWSSYQATGGLRDEPEYLTTDWILGLFNSKRVVAQRQYRAFVREGIHGGSPWTKLRGQVVLGEERFVERLKDLLQDKKQVKEIPRPQRYISRPGLEKIFGRQEAKGQRNRGIYEAYLSHGYTLKEIADHLGIHYTTVSKLIVKVEEGKK